MNSKSLVRLLTVAVLAGGCALAQEAGAALSGSVKDPFGTAVKTAAVSVRNTATGQTSETRTDAAGRYVLPNLAPGSYEVSVTAEGLAAKTATVTLAAGARQTLDVSLAAIPGKVPPISLGDLGLTPGQTSGSAQQQALLDRRSHMLRIHQRLGLITIAPMVATLIASNGAAGRRATGSGRELHAALGGVTACMYFTTASFAIFAPKVPETSVRGPIRLHRALAWIHGPGMILTPILGALAYQQRSRGERVHGIAQAHGPVAIVTSAAFGLAVLSVTLKF